MAVPATKLPTKLPSNNANHSAVSPNEEKLAILAAIEEEKQAILDPKTGCQYFISTYVKIEDRDEALHNPANLSSPPKEPDPEAEGIAVPFRLWPGQIKALAMLLVQRLLIILKARQLGLTWLVLAYAVWRLINSPGYSVIALSKKETPDAKELVRRVKFILRYLPRWLIREKASAGPNWQGLTWEATVLTITIYHPGKEPSTLISMASSQDAARSLTCNLLILDEWAFQQWAEEIWDSAFPTINRPTGGQVIGLSTAKRVTLFERIWKAAADFGFVKIFLNWRTDPRRDEKWREATKRALPYSWMQEYPETEEEAFSAGEGTAFPEFAREIHVVKPFDIPAWWRRWRSNDPGYTDPFAWYCFAASPTGQIYVYREYTREPGSERVAYSDQARELTRRCVMVEEGQGAGEQPERQPLWPAWLAQFDPNAGVGPAGPGEAKTVPEKFDFTVCGRDAFNRHPETGKSIVDYYQEGGVVGCIEPPRDAKTDRILRAAVVHEYLRPYYDENLGRVTARLQIFNTCKMLIETLPALTVDENDAEKVAECDLDHWYDALGYGLVAWHAQRSKTPEPEKGKIERDKEKLAKLRRRVRQRWT